MNNIEFSGLPIKIFNMIDTTVPPILIFIIGLVILAGMVYFHVRKKRFKSATIKYSDIRIVKRAVRSSRQRYRFLLTVFRVLAVAVFIIAFARPRSGTQITEVTSEGIDIMIALDLSPSMRAEDFKPNNRLHVAKQEIKKFIQRRFNDRIGLVVFGGVSYTQCPLTVDYGVLLNLVDEVDFDMMPKDGTAIGMALANGVNRLRDSDAESKIIILLTDGENNAGEIDPLTATNLAKALGIKIYTIAAGKRGNVMMPTDDPLFGKRYRYAPSTINDGLLKQIASETGGQHYWAQSGEELEEIYTLIDALEKTEVKSSTHTQYSELFHFFAYAGFLLLMLEMVLAGTYFRKLP